MSSLLYIPLRVYRVGGVLFTDTEVGNIIERTNSKLAKLKIRIDASTVRDIGHASQAIVDPKTPAALADLKDLLQNGSGLDQPLRLFLVRANHENGSYAWTYDPVNINKDERLWGGAIFLTEFWRDSSDQSQIAKKYHAKHDSILHELGHVLLRQAGDFEMGEVFNFMNKNISYLDDTICPEQGRKMRGEPPYRPRSRFVTEKPLFN